MNRRVALRTVVLALLGALLALAAVACSSDDTAKVVADSETTTSAPEDESTTTDDEPSDDSDTTDSTGSTGSTDAPASASGDLTLPDGVEVGAVTCSGDGQSSGDVATDVDCSAAHTSESVSITGARDLDDCYRAIATFSDVVIVVDDDGEFDIDDERVSGHAFGGYDSEYDCQITLADARTEPLIDR